MRCLGPGLLGDIECKKLNVELNSSLFTVATFVNDEIKYKNAKLGMDLGFVTAVATGAAVYFIYGDKGKVAAAAAVITGAALYAAYYCKLRGNPKINGYMMGGSRSSKRPWTPLTDEEIQNMKNIVNSKMLSIENYNGISVVSEP